MGYGGAILPWLQAYERGVDDVGVGARAGGKVGRNRGCKVFLTSQGAGQPLTLGAYLLIVFLERYFLGVGEGKEYQRGPSILSLRQAATNDRLTHKTMYHFGTATDKGRFPMILMGALRHGPGTLF